jgi:rfaE bifunctional protein nucleotidyltransferase chain/domain/rfaE bifunctional protein kinase chain/domain
MLDREVVGTADRLCPEAPVPVLDHERASASAGGAALAAAMLASDGHDVTLVTAVGHDEAGIELADLLADAGVRVVNLGLEGATHEKVRLRSGGHLLCRLDRGSGLPRTAGRLALEAVEQAAGVLVSDYGRGVCADGGLRAALERSARVTWDPHPRGAPPTPHAALVTPNLREAMLAAGDGTAEEVAERLLRLWRADAVCVTCGGRGAVLAARGRSTLTVPVDEVAGDPCGAGDRFAATAAALLARGVDLPEAVATAAAEARAHVAGDGRGGQERDGEAEAVVERTRRRGGTVVATGGCFDLLHAGHVSMLQAARRLGDCLVVCLNSDASVRRLKGPDRPLVAEDDRAAVLRALGCVDAVALFDEDTPGALLQRLRPHLFVKGGDYDAATLPEAAVLDRFGGRVVTVPYVAGQSTTSLIERAGVGVA